ERLRVVLEREVLRPPRRRVAENLAHLLERGQHHPDERRHRQDGKAVEQHVRQHALHRGSTLFASYGCHVFNARYRTDLPSLRRATCPYATVPLYHRTLTHSPTPCL